MVTRLTRLLLVVQCLVATLLGTMVHRAWPALPAWIAFFIGLGSVLIIRALITANNFWMTEGFLGQHTHHRLSWHGCVHLYWRELCATLLSTSWFMPFRAMSGSPTCFPQGLPVLLLHGYAGNSGYWRPLSCHLQTARISWHAIDLEPLFGDIDGYTSQVTAAIQTLCAASGQRRVIIVAHSMGGLVARAWMRAQGNDQVAALITLGTPHAGTTTAHFAPGINAHQMRRTGDRLTGHCSAWLQTLNASQNPLPVPVVSIYSCNDNIIAPQNSCYLPGANNIVLHNMGHVLLGTDATVAACVIAEIHHIWSLSPLRGALPCLPR